MQLTMTVPQAARRVLRNPETIRRWIREGKLRAEKVGTQHLIDEDDLDAFVSDGVLPAPPHWDVMEDGSPMPPVEEIIRRQRESH